MVEKQRLYVDIDGTLAVFTPVDKLETLYEQGYFLNLRPIDKMVQAVKKIIQHNPDIEVHIMSAYLSDSKFALEEKNAWLDKHLPEIDSEHRTFPPCGVDKKDYVKGGIRNSDFLLDDYTHNLKLWQPPAQGIKLLNGINHTHGTWEHDRIRYDKYPLEIAKNIVDIMQGKERIYDDIPSSQRVERNMNMENNKESKIIQLIDDLINAESMKENIEGSLKDSNIALSKANFITKILQKESLLGWEKNKKQCQHYISEYNEQIKKIEQQINDLGFSSEDVSKIKETLDMPNFIDLLQDEHPWTKLLNQEEKDKLLVEIAIDNVGDYKHLLGLSNYINSFNTDEEKLDYINGFLPEFKETGKTTAAYKVGELFYVAATSCGIDLAQALQDYAPEYRHDLKFVSLVKELRYEDDLRYMTIENLNEPIGAGCSPDDLKYYYDEIVVNRLHADERWEEQLKDSENKISSIKEKINTFQFYGKIDFLGQDKQGETIVGETLYYDNYKDYIKEIKESRDCGRPIHVEEISKVEYTDKLHANIDNIEKPLELPNGQNLHTEGKKTGNSLKSINTDVLTKIQKEKYVLDLAKKHPDRAAAYIQGVKSINPKEGDKLEQALNKVNNQHHHEKNQAVRSR